MSDTKWQPGPWKPHATGLARSGLPEHEIHWSDDGECVAEIVHGEAEAHLIAAAPELYAALEDAIQALRNFHGCKLDGVRNKPLDFSLLLSGGYEALAKARGE